MNVHAYRIVKSRYAETAFSGEGAKTYGGRWNSPGTAIVYAASTRSLAMLETLVGMESRQLLLKYIAIPLTFDESLIREVDVNALPDDWRASPAPLDVQAIGDEWVASGKSTVLRVPSVIVPEEVNYLLNPNHSSFAGVKIGKSQPIEFDPRLK